VIVVRQIHIKNIVQHALLLFRFSVTAISAALSATLDRAASFSWYRHVLLNV